jgi:hypothetical protein
MSDIFELTSYKESKNVAPKGMYDLSAGAGPMTGFEACYKATQTYAATITKEIPENTRSNPADRIMRIRESISWTDSTKADAVQKSSAFRQSALLFIQCVLSSVYGENISVQYIKVDDLKRDKSYPGREFFIDKMLDALGLGREFIIELKKNDGTLIGLLSSAGPIPTVEHPYSLDEFWAQLNKLRLSDPQNVVFNFDTESKLLEIIDRMNIQDKEILLFWFEQNQDNEVISQCLLYKYIKDNLKDTQKITIESANAMGQNFEIEKKIDASFPCFPMLKEHRAAGLLSRITLLPLKAKNSKFGYDFPKLEFQHDGIDYVFLPPLAEPTVESTKSGNFKVITLDLVKDPFGYDDKHKLNSVSIRCELEYNNVKINVRKTYTNAEIHFIKGFPQLHIYGPAPASGWIALREHDNEDYPSPLADAMEDNLKQKDICFGYTKLGEESNNNRPVIFEELTWEDTGELYKVYCGEINQWLCVESNGKESLGAIPLRALQKLPVWSDNDPNFAHPCNPISGKMVVAVDIGSSRSAVVFKKNDVLDPKIHLIEKDQILSIPLNSWDDKDSTWPVMFFQPGKQANTVKGKMPVGILATGVYSNETKESLLLYKSGKLMLLDPESISHSTGRKIYSDIKAGSEKNPNAMDLLAQGLLTMIIDKALHEGCVNIEIRLSYLKERFTTFQQAWERAKRRILDVIPKMEKPINIDIQMRLPESLAIANCLSNENELHTDSGAAIIDIGDFTTDFALYAKPGKEVVYKKSKSVLFAGRQIILQPIWDYLQFSLSRVDSLFETASKPDKEAVARLQTTLDKLKEKNNTPGTPVAEDIRRDILCLMDKIKRDRIPAALRNLFDICYLTEVVLLKRLLTIYGIEKNDGGSFEIYLFGGGSALLQEGDLDWDAVLGRSTEAVNKSRKQGSSQLDEEGGNKLALGLLFDIADNLKTASEEARKEGEKYKKGDNEAQLIKPSSDELRRGYIRFLKNAQVLKQWDVMDKFGNRMEEGDLFNVRKAGPNFDGKIIDENIWKRFYNEAIDFATEGSITEKELIIALFSYKMAYRSAVDFYIRQGKA